jgi:spore germination protein KB
MPGKIRITKWQSVMLLVGFLIGSSALAIPLGPSGRDSWISVLIAGVIGVLELLLLVWISDRFPKKLPAEIFIECMGNHIGTFVAFLYVWYCFHLGALVTLDITEAYYLTVFLRTPEVVAKSILTGLAVVAVYLGLEVLARSSEVIVPLLVFNILLLTALSVMTTGILNLESLLPVLEKGLVPVLKGAWEVFAFPFGELIVFFSVLPYVGDRDSLKTWLLGGEVSAILLLTQIQIRNISILGAVRGIVFPSLSAVSLVVVGQFIQRLDAVLLFIWTFAAFLKISICLFATVVNLKVLLKLHDERLLSLPVGVSMTTLSLHAFRNVADLMDFTEYVWPIYSLPFQLFLPLCILVFSLVKRQK